MRPARNRDPREAEIGSVRSHLADLRGWYVALFEVTGKDGRSPTAEARGAASPEPPVPVNLSILDLIVRLERTVDRVETRTRRTLFSLPPAMRRDMRNRAGDPLDGLSWLPVPSTGPHAARWIPVVRSSTSGVMPDQRVIDGLRWLSEVVPDVLDRGYRDELVEPLLAVHRAARSALGLSERAYPLDSICPFCELRSIIARPDRDLVVCGNPTCRDDKGRVRTWRTTEVAQQRADEERRARVRVPLPTTGDAPRWIHLPRTEVYPNE